MPGTEARPRPSLLDLQPLRTQNGPPLPLARNLRWAKELQGFPAFLVIHDNLLLRLLWSERNVGVDRDFA